MSDQLEEGLERRLLSIAEHPELRSPFWRAAWSVADFRLLGAKKRRLPEPDRAAVVGYLNSVERAMRAAGWIPPGVVWHRERYQRIKNVVRNFPTRNYGAVTLQLLAVVPSQRYLPPRGHPLRDL